METAYPQLHHHARNNSHEVIARSYCDETLPKSMEQTLEKWKTRPRGNQLFYATNQKPVSRFWDILWLVKSWQVIPMFRTQCFGSTSNSCEKLRRTVICSTTRLYSQGPLESWVVGSFICTWLANPPFLLVCIISCAELLINISICNILKSRTAWSKLFSKHWTFILLLLRLSHSRKSYPRTSCY